MIYPDEICIPFTHILNNHEFHIKFLRVLITSILNILISLSVCNSSGILKICHGLKAFLWTGAHDTKWGLESRAGTAVLHKIAGRVIIEANYSTLICEKIRIFRKSNKNNENIQ